MTAGAPRVATACAFEGREPHLVIKRGHHGRYRFALMSEDGRITGEVSVEAAGDRAAEQGRAMAKIARLAQGLAGLLADSDAGTYVGISRDERVASGLRVVGSDREGPDGEI